jgi:3-hydroxybutyryl-CoA dehydrogenase
MIGVSTGRGAATMNAIKPDTPIGIVGGGLMGIGIATRCALAGFGTTVIETDPARAGAVVQGADDVLAQLAEAGRIDDAGRADALARLRVASDVDALAGAGAVIEAIPEVLEAKHALYARLEAILAGDALIASNTSGFPPDALAAPLRQRARFLVAHFWNPPHLIPLVEVVPGSATAPAAVASTVALMRTIGAEPVVLKAAIPGFIGNRLQFAVLRDALHIVRSGAADPETVDAVMKASLGRRWSIMGPFEGADLGGLNTFLAIAEHLVPALAGGQDDLALLREHVDRGETGAASGQGFYTWDDARREDVRARRMRQLTSSDS